MSARSHWNGHKIVYQNEEWVYSDTGRPVSSDPPRACCFCGLKSTPQGHDGCIGTLPGVMNACCGHGVTPEAYVQFDADHRISGEAALQYIAANRSQHSMSTPSVRKP